MHLFRKRATPDAGPLRDIDLDAEMSVLERQYHGMIQEQRVRWLAGRLGTGLAIRDSDCGFCGDRLAMVLDNGSMLVLRLLWPERRRLVQLDSIRWNDDTGWEVWARSTAGEAVCCSAWRASVTLASEIVADVTRATDRPARRAR